MMLNIVVQHCPTKACMEERSLIIATCVRERGAHIWRSGGTALYSVTKMEYGVEEQMEREKCLTETSLGFIRRRERERRVYS